MTRARMAWAWLIVSLVVSGSRGGERIAASRPLAPADGIVFGSTNELLYWGGTLGATPSIPWESYPHACLWNRYCDSLPPSPCEQLARIAQCGPHWSNAHGCSCGRPCIRVCNRRSHCGHRIDCGVGCEPKRLCGCSRPALSLFADLLTGPRHGCRSVHHVASCTDPASGSLNGPESHSQSGSDHKAKAPQPPAAAVTDPTPVPPNDLDVPPSPPESQGEHEEEVQNPIEASEAEKPHDTWLPRNTVPN